MIYPVCPTCGTSLADKEQPYLKGLLRIINDPKLGGKEKDRARGQLMTDLGIKRYCCRMRVMGNIPEEEIIAPPNGYAARHRHENVVHEHDRT